MKRTGIFLTYFQRGRLRDFPQALAGTLMLTIYTKISYYLYQLIGTRLTWGLKSYEFWSDSRTPYGESKAGT